MALDFGIFSNLNAVHGFLILIVFILLVLARKKVLGIVMNAVWITVAAVLFPIFTNRVLGLPVPSDTDSIILFIVTGLGLYFLYLLSKSVYSLLSITEKAGKKISPKIEIKEKEKRKDRKEIVKKTPSAPLAKQFFAKSVKVKGEKELFKDYVIIEDKETVEIKEDKNINEIRPDVTKIIEMERIQEKKFRKSRSKNHIRK